MREITAEEVRNLGECLCPLADYHNRVSIYFKGSYPSRPYESALRLFERALSEGTSRIAVAEENGCIVGFCKVDLHAETGKLDYLVVREEYRKKGYGKALMDWAMETFRQYNLCRVEVKVVDGNETIHLYEKYGFKMNAHILVNDGRRK